MKYKIKKGLIFEKKGKKITIFDPEKLNMYYFNETAALILNCLKKKKDKDEIIKLFKNRYRVVKTDLLKDINDTIKQLKKEKLIVSK